MPQCVLHCKFLFEIIVKQIKNSIIFFTDTERGIFGLQRQLEKRDRELADERGKRQLLEKHFEKKTEKRLMNDLAKRSAYF